MNTIIQSHINLCLLDEYAYKSVNYGYSLHVSDLPDNEVENFLDLLFKHDPATREFIVNRMQDLIDEQMPLYECRHRYKSGFVPVQDRTNGEINWVPGRGY